MTSTKKVIILNKVNSPHISQAIFILKDETTDEFYAVYEAERIVNEYLHSFPKRKKRPYRMWAALLAAVFVSCISLYFLFG